MAVADPRGLSPFPAHAEGADLEHSLPRAVSQARPGLMIGAFQPNCSWDFWPTTAERETSWTYAYNRDTVQLADELGLAFAFPAGRWKGIQGDVINWRGASLDTITLTAGLLEATKRITLLTTIHTNVFSPVVAAKLGADLDHIGEGRWGLNVVTGWDAEEFHSLGIDMLEHADRYEYTREWLDIIEELWKTGVCTYDGKYFTIHGAELAPRPRQAPTPLIVNAGSSPVGMQFAIDRANYLFATRAIAAPKFREMAAESQSETGYIATRKVIVRRTRKEADEVAAQIQAGTDVKALRSQGARQPAVAGATRTAEAYSMTPEMIRKGILGDAVIGDPESVAKELAAWAVEWKLDAICLIPFDYQQDLELIGSEVFPVMREELKRLGSDLVLTTDRAS